MDIAFHAVSAAVLAQHLGERRRSALLLAALVGMNPDIIAHIGYIFLPGNLIYPLSHSLLTQLAICLIIYLLNRRIAFGGLLHILIDVISHRYTTRYLLYPLWRFQGYPNVSWSRADGIWLWSLLWIILLLILYRDLKTSELALRRQT